MDAISIAGAAVCMVGMCGVMMWLMMRFGHGSKQPNDEPRRNNNGHVA